MIEDRTPFLNFYIQSLAERTREERDGAKFGFDWIIYNLALSEGLIPQRLPFFRSGGDETAKTKPEAEFGIDLAFLSRDKTKLTIFVLKNKPLKNTTWHKSKFHDDMCDALSPDLGSTGLEHVKEVKVILAYNKDEDKNGIQKYENFVNSRGTKVGDDISLSFERWNLTKLTEEVKEKLLSPTLLPQKFFSLFTYICSQFGDFRHGSEEWTNQLIPNWIRFLDDLLKDKADERTIRLIPVALIILQKEGSQNPTYKTGWIELIEWALLSAWKVYRSTDDYQVKIAVYKLWINLYLDELEHYYEASTERLVLEDGLVGMYTGSYVDSVAASVVAYWHIARLGLLCLGIAEILPELDEGPRKEYKKTKQKMVNLLVALLNGNSAAFRPLIDLHHIELFLVWAALYTNGRGKDIYAWLSNLQQSLLVRRAATTPLPFIDGTNNLELVFEAVATGKKQPELCENSSMLLLCIIEWCFSLPNEEQRDLLLNRYYHQIVHAKDPDGTPIENTEPIDLIGWNPPDDWCNKVFCQSLAGEGEAQSLHARTGTEEKDEETLAQYFENFIQQCRKKRTISFPDGTPISAVVLACLKHRSPLPAELWRVPIFGEQEANQEESAES